MPILAIHSATLEHLTDIFPKSFDWGTLIPFVVAAFIVFLLAALAALFTLSARHWGRWVPFLAALLWFLPWLLRTLAPDGASLAATLEPACLLLFPLLVLGTLGLMAKGRHFVERTLLGSSVILTLYFLWRLYETWR